MLWKFWVDDVTVLVNVLAVLDDVVVVLVDVIALLTADLEVHCWLMGSVA